MKNKYFYMNEIAISHIIGIVLMVVATIVIAGTIMVMVGGFALPDIPPYVIISVNDSEGGMGVNLENNSVKLLHRSGDMLYLNEIKTIMQGHGQTYWSGSGYRHSREVPIIVTYDYTHSNGKDGTIEHYDTRNSMLLTDGYWSVGEILNLNGYDSRSAQRPNSTITVAYLWTTQIKPQLINGNLKKIQK